MPETENKTLKQFIKKYQFLDYEADENTPIPYDMYHIDDVFKAVREWLLQKQQERTRENDLSEGAYRQLQELLSVVS